MHAHSRNDHVPKCREADEAEQTLPGAAGSHYRGCRRRTSYYWRPPNLSADDADTNDNPADELQ